jgi:hypothetical protein
LRPAPESRSRGAYPHLLRSFTTRISFHLLLLPCFCSTHAVALISVARQCPTKPLTRNSLCSPSHGGNASSCISNPLDLSAFVSVYLLPEPGDDRAETDASIEQVVQTLKAEGVATAEIGRAIWTELTPFLRRSWVNRDRSPDCHGPLRRLQSRRGEGR